MVSRSKLFVSNGLLLAVPERCCVEMVVSGDRLASWGQSFAESASFRVRLPTDSSTGAVNKGSTNFTTACVLACVDLVMYLDAVGAPVDQQVVTADYHGL